MKKGKAEGAFTCVPITRAEKEASEGEERRYIYIYIFFKT